VYASAGPRLIVGDSILLGAKFDLQSACPDADVIAEEGRSLGWMRAEIVAKLKEKKYGQVFVLGGINDIAGGAPLESLTRDAEEIALESSMEGASPIFGTVLPFHGYANGAYSWTVEKQRTADRFNDHLRTLNHVETNIALRSSTMPQELAQQYRRTKEDDMLHLGTTGSKYLASYVARYIGCRK
jgi:hypothetical protein